MWYADLCPDKISVSFFSKIHQYPEIGGRASIVRFFLRPNLRPFSGCETKKTFIHLSLRKVGPILSEHHIHLNSLKC
jgi:hypothetical protein